MIEKKSTIEPPPREKIRIVPTQSETIQIHQDYHRLYSIIGADIQKDIEVAISQKARPQGLYIIGANGTGKST